MCIVCFTKLVTYKFSYSSTFSVSALRGNDVLFPKSLPPETES